jgi:hypothetical protein
MVKANISTQTNLIKRLISFIGLSSPKSRVIIFSSILVALYLLPYSILVNLPKMSLYQIFGIKTYSLGQTRAISLILHGQFLEAWEMNKLSYLILLMVIFIVTRDLKKILTN